MSYYPSPNQDLEAEIDAENTMRDALTIPGEHIAAIKRLFDTKVTDLKPSDPEANTRQAKSQKEAELKLKGE